MPTEKIWTAAELEKLPPNERDQIIRSGIVSDLNEVPESFLQRIQENVAEHIATSEPAPTTER